MLWGLLGGQAEDMQTAELDFASVVLDPADRAKLPPHKGSTPVRLDARAG